MNSTEIAKLIGVSRSTVSRVLNGYTNVPPATKEKVEKALKKYGYTPNNAARNLRGKPSKIIGMFFIGFGNKIPASIHSSPFFSEFLVFFTDALKTHRYQLLVSIINNKSEMNIIKNLFIDKTISGAVLMGDKVPDSFLEEMNKDNYKCILVNQRDDCKLDNILLVNTENFKPSYEAVQLLIDKGHTRIANIAGKQSKISTIERYRAYCQCLKNNNIALDPDLVIFENIHKEYSGYNAGMELIKKNKDNLPTAVFCCNDLMAIGFIRAMNELEIRVPEDISVIGFDNTELSKCSTPKLSTVSTDINKIANITAESFVKFIEIKGSIKNLKKQIISEYNIIERESIKELF